MNKFISKTLLKFLISLIPIKKVRKKIRSKIRSKVCSEIEVAEAKKAFVYVKKYCQPIVEEPYCDKAKVEDMPIWQLWFQGEDNAPEIIKVCFASVKKHAKNRKVIVLDDETWRQYISLPEYIVEKYNDKTIGPAHMSDVIRVCLLEKYGGTWIDATILLTNSLPQYIESSPFFVFKAINNSTFVAKYKGLTLGPNGFIHANPQHTFIKNIKRALFEYWKHENKAQDYLFFHMMFKNLVESNKKLQSLFDGVTTTNYLYNNQLQINLYAKFDEDLLEGIKEKTAVNKLTHNIRDLPLNDTFLEFILKNKGVI